MRFIVKKLGYKRNKIKKNRKKKLTKIDLSYNTIS